MAAVAAGEWSGVIRWEWPAGRVRPRWESGNLLVEQGSRMQTVAPFTRTRLFLETEKYSCVCTLRLHANGEFASENDAF